MKMVIHEKGIGHMLSFRRDEKPYGLTYGQWTVKWWQWALETPASINPVADETGEYAGINQDGPVWFLAGTFGENRVPRRKCMIPSEKSILFPVINYAASYIEKQYIRTDSDLIGHVTLDMNDIVNLVAKLDGQDLEIDRVRSDPSTFDLIIHDENKIGVLGGKTTAAADGYWVFLKRLLPGQHNIYFHGACSGGSRNSTANYDISVQE